MKSRYSLSIDSLHWSLLQALLALWRWFGFLWILAKWGSILCEVRGDCFKGIAGIYQSTACIFIIQLASLKIMKDERWIIEKIEKNSTLDVFFPAGFTSIEFSEWCNAKAFNKLGIALLEPCRSLLGLDLRAPLILSLSRHQKTVLAVVVLSFCRVATPESFKPWHSLIIEVLPEIPHDALDLIMRLLAFDAQFRDTIFSKSGSSVVLRSLATSFAIQVLTCQYWHTLSNLYWHKSVAESRKVCHDHQGHVAISVRFFYFHLVECILVETCIVIPSACLL